MVENQKLFRVSKLEEQTINKDLENKLIEKQNLTANQSRYIPPEKFWESPQKTQQVWFIKLMGSNVNLGNIAFNEVIPLECLRLGLRGDTFFDHIPK